MKYLYQDTKIKVWFARWTKTPWAVFNSLRVVVHILSVDISAFKSTLLSQLGINKESSQSDKSPFDFDLRFTLPDNLVSFTLFRRVHYKAINSDLVASSIDAIHFKY